MPLPPYLLYTFLTLFGLCIGSFLNVCIFRLPRERSVVFPRSFCPKCRASIGWYDNIPVFSYLLLRGKCRSCDRRISPQYPAVEILTAAFACWTYYYFGEWLPFALYYFLLICPLIVITFIDLEHRIIPDSISISGIFVGAVVHYIMTHGPITKVGLDIILGILIGGGFLALIGYGYEWLKKEEGLGGGDVKLAAMLGAFFGWKGILFILLVSSVIGSLVGVALLLFFGKERKYPIPYGPFLAVAAIIYLFAGDMIVGWYLGLMR